MVLGEEPTLGGHLRREVICGDPREVTLGEVRDQVRAQDALTMSTCLDLRICIPPSPASASLQFLETRPSCCTRDVAVECRAAVGPIRNCR